MNKWRKLLSTLMLLIAAILLTYSILTGTGNDYLTSQAQNLGATNLALSAMLAYLGLWLGKTNIFDSNTKN